MRATLASLFSPPARGRAVAAWSLAADEAVVTALGNDVGFELIFKRQIIAHGRDRDVAIALSDIRQLRGPDDGHHRSQAARDCSRSDSPATTAAGWRWPRISTHCFTVHSPEHPPHPGEPRHARFPALVGRRRNTWPVLETECTLHEPNRRDDRRQNAKTVCWNGSTSSGSDVRGCSKTWSTLAHGAGGKSSAALVDAVFSRRSATTSSNNSATPPRSHRRRVSGSRSSTDSFVVQPRRLPGGSIGHVAVHGTINDLAVSGARPQWLSAAFVIEEGFPIAELREIVADMSEAAAKAGVQIVTGDTKVVGKGAADGVYISTAGVGVIPEGRRLSRDLVAARRQGVGVRHDRRTRNGGHARARRPGHRRRHRLRTPRPSTNWSRLLLEAAPSTRWMRDATRGGVGTVANELVKDSPFALILDEDEPPIQPQVLGACDMLGIDPLYVANEGKFVAIVAAEEADAAIAALRRASAGRRRRRWLARSSLSRTALSRSELRSAAAESSTCSSATRYRESANRALRGD